MIELYLYVKIFLDYFPGRLKNAKFGELKKMPVPKVVLHRFIKNYIGVYDLIELISHYFKICL